MHFLVSLVCLVNLAFINVVFTEIPIWRFYFDGGLFILFSSLCVYIYIYIYLYIFIYIYFLFIIDL